MADGTSVHDDWVTLCCLQVAEVIAEQSRIRIEDRTAVGRSASPIVGPAGTRILDWATSDLNPTSCRMADPNAARIYDPTYFTVCPEVTDPGSLVIRGVTDCDTQSQRVIHRPLSIYLISGFQMHR